MIRKTIIVMLTLMAASTAVCWVAIGRFDLEDHIFDRWGLRIDRGWWGFGSSVGEGWLNVNASRNVNSAWSGEVCLSYGYWIEPSAPEEPPERSFRLGGVRAEAGEVYYEDGVGLVRSRPYEYELVVSLWVLFVLFGAYPTLAFVRGRLPRRHRRKKGHCLTCAYDLTGNESGVCPECGTKCSIECHDQKETANA